ncbi:MAG: retropepsin-like domain-containing protein [Deltaproteobacteria bacterium]|nr:retropepsin-like domain-containing protein [Deltaproteobacteria bacterium]MDQ3296173.1 retroviral-like aspartic protease family protein [Myxococcota bacterium]
MRLTIQHRLPFVTLTVTHRGLSLDVAGVLVDTGSASTVLDADIVGEIGILARDGGNVRKLHGIGGREDVFEYQVDRVEVGGRALEPFVIEIGAEDYGYGINGILGMDFMVAAGAMIDLHVLELGFAA